MDIESMAQSVRRLLANAESAINLEQTYGGRVHSLEATRRRMAEARNLREVAGALEQALGRLETAIVQNIKRSYENSGEERE